MKKKASKKSELTSENVRRLSEQIEGLFYQVRRLKCDIQVAAMLSDKEAGNELVERINSLVQILRRIEKQPAALFLFERSYRASRDELAPLDGRFGSYHERSLHTSSTFLNCLLMHKAEEMPVLDSRAYAIPSQLDHLDLDTADRIALEFKQEFQANETASELAIEAAHAANLVEDPAALIPNEYRTRVMTKQQAAALMGRPNVDSGVRWLNSCIEIGVIKCHKMSRQGYIFDISDFPKAVWDRIRP